MAASVAVRTVLTMLAAFDARDIDRFVSHMTADVVVRPPGFLLGQTEQVGPDEVQAAFAELDATLGPDRTLNLRKRRLYLDRQDDSTLLVLMELTITPERGEEFGDEAALLVTFSGDKVSRIDSWPTQEEGLAQLGEPVLVHA